MRTRTTTTLTIALLLATLTACGSTVDPAACKTAMAAQLDKNVAADAEAKGTGQPDSCDGLDNKTLERLAGEVTTEYLEGSKMADEIEKSLDDVEQDMDDTFEDLGITPTP